jgi:hypothetical protein
VLEAGKVAGLMRRSSGLREAMDEARACLDGGKKHGRHDRNGEESIHSVDPLSLPANAVARLKP